MNIRMKKIIFSVAVLAAIALGSGWYIAQSENEVNLSDLALSNVEALAGGLPQCKWKVYLKPYPTIEQGLYFDCQPNGQQCCP